MIRALAAALLSLAACGGPASTEPGVPRLIGADLGQACAAWRDEPRRLPPSRAPRARSIFAGPDHACATVDDGRAVCWGWNEAGRLIGGSREFVPTPTFLRGLTDIAELEHGCARTVHGTVHCWDGGPLDAGGRRLISDYLPPLERARIRRAGASCGPVRVPDIEDAIDVDVGDAFACALQTNGRVYCWGDNTRAQLARVVDPEQESMPQVVPWLSDVRDLAAGARHVCALVRGGEVACWGDNDKGQLGVSGPRFSGRPHPVPGVDRVVEIDAAGDHTCARRRDGTVVCWGEIGFAEGDERPVARVCEPTEVPGLEDIVEIDAGGFDCARRWNGRVACWSELDCGHGRKSERYGSGRPRTVPNLDRVLEISAGQEHACARRRGGRVLCWGEAGSGALGTHAPELETRAELHGLPTLRQPIGTGRDRLCGLDRNRHVVCTTLSASPPQPPPQRLDAISEPVTELVSAPLLDCALTRSGKVACWGEEGNVLPVTELERADHIYALWSSAACAHLHGGGTVCWGAEVTSLHTSATGEPLDDEDEVAHWHAESIDTPVDVVHMVLDRRSVCGITAQARVVCWPLADSEDPLTFSRLSLAPDDEAEEGDHDADAAATESIPAPRPVLEVEISDVIDIKATNQGFCARTETGTIACWQVEANAPDPITPVPVTDLIGVVDWGRGAWASELCAVAGDGSVSCWSTDVQAADPSPSITATRLEVDSANALLRLGAHPCVLRDEGRLLCWGGPFRGTPLSRDTDLFVAKPVPIAGFGRVR